MTCHCPTEVYFYILRRGNRLWVWFVCLVIFQSDQILFLVYYTVALFCFSHSADSSLSGLVFDKTTTICEELDEYV